MSNIDRQSAEKLQEMQSKFWQPIIGLAMIGFGIYMYYELNAMEQCNGSVRINWLFYYAYQLGGKWLVSSIICIIGVLLTFFGIKAFIKKK